MERRLELPQGGRTSAPFRSPSFFEKKATFFERMTRILPNMASLCPLRVREGRGARRPSTRDTPFATTGDPVGGAMNRVEKMLVAAGEILTPFVRRA